MTPVRPRKANRQLPPCVYVKHGAYWHVKKNKWTRLGDDLPEALREYAKLASPTGNGMQGLMTRWLETLTDKSPATLKLYKQAADKIADTFAEFEPRQITPSIVAEWLAHESRTPSWANRQRTALKLAMDKAVLWGLADSNPVISIPRAKEKERTRYITDSEYQAIHAKAEAPLKIIIELCFYTAQRISDVLAIRLANLTDDGIAIEQQKTGARLVIGWTSDLRRVIASAKGMGGNVRGMHLLCYNGKPYRYHAVYAAWVVACKAAGVSDAHIHDLRAKSLTDANKQGINAQALAGHTTQKQTDHYIKQRDIPIVQSPKFGAKF